jgi:hypothetical protein
MKCGSFVGCNNIDCNSNCSSCRARARCSSTMCRIRCRSSCAFVETAAAAHAHEFRFVSYHSVGLARIFCGLNCKDKVGGLDPNSNVGVTARWCVAKGGNSAVDSIVPGVVIV